MPADDARLFDPDPEPAGHRDPTAAPLPTRPQARARRDDAMQRVDANADDDWEDAAIRLVRDLPRGHEFLTEDIREALDAGGFHVHDRRALGPLVKAQQRAGIIDAIGYRAARSSNLSPKVLWVRL